MNTKLGKVCSNENAEHASVAILRDGSSPVLAATNGKVLAVVMTQLADDHTVPAPELPRRIPSGLCSGSAKNPNTIQIGAGVNRSLFGPEMVAVSQSMGRFGQVRDAIPFPPVGDAMPEVDDQWVCIEVNVQQLLDLVHAITTTDNEAGPHTVLLGVHHTKEVVAVQGDQGGGVLAVNQRVPADLGLYSTMRNVVKATVPGVPAHRKAKVSEAEEEREATSVTITHYQHGHQPKSVTLTGKSIDRAAEIAERIKPRPLGELSESQVYDLLLVDLPGMNAAAANRLSEAGINTIRDYAARAQKPGGIRTVKGIGEGKAERLEEVVNGVWRDWKKGKFYAQLQANAPGAKQTD